MFEKRTEERKSLKERVDLELVVEGSDGGVLTRIVSCRTVDISGGGMRILMTPAVPIATVIDMTVLVDGGERKFHLTGEVRWVRPAPEEPGWFLAGFEIYETDESDSAAWRYFVHKAAK